MKTHTPIHQSSNSTISSSPHPTALDPLVNAPSPADTALVPSSATPGALSTTRSDTHAPHRLLGFPIHPLIHASSHCSARRPRNGKIARLPKPVREVVNRMLSLNIPQENIVAALQELGIKVTQSNISNWKTRGGYREWCLAQEHATSLRLHQDSLLDLMRRHDAHELPEIGLQAAATQLSSFFLTTEACQLLASDPKGYERRVSVLNRISARLKALQECRDAAAKALGPDHDPDRIRHETNSSLERLTDAFTCEVGDSAKDPDIPHRNLLPHPAELFNYTDRALDDDSHRDKFLEFLERWFPSASKTQSPNDPAQNEKPRP